MATIVSQDVFHLGRHIGLFKKYILFKSAANFTEIIRKHVFAASNRNKIKSLKEEFRTNFVKKLQFFISNLNLYK